jgi:adenosylcobinamide-GDP ribazoletransferase
MSGGLRLWPPGLEGAVQFLTRIPIDAPHAVPHRRVVPWFPFVGALIGAAVGGVAVGMKQLVPTSVAATLAVVAGLLITGAFHEDGLADIADAFGGGWTVERRLEILKDSRHGTYGVAALTGSIVLRVVSAAAITASSALFAGFVAAHVLGRSASVVAMRLAPPAHQSGLGVDAARELRLVPTSIGLVAGLAITAILTGWWVAVLVPLALAGSAVVVALAVRKIGGLAGDVLGAVEQVVECVVLVAVAGLASNGPLWWA